MPDPYIRWELARNEHQDRHAVRSIAVSIRVYQSSRIGWPQLFRVIVRDPDPARADVAFRDGSRPAAGGVTQVREGAALATVADNGAS